MKYQISKIMLWVSCVLCLAMQGAQAQTLSDGAGGKGELTVTQTGANDYVADVVYTNYHVGTYVVNGTVHSSVKVSYPTPSTIHLVSGTGNLNLQYASGVVPISATSDFTIADGVVHMPISWSAMGKVYSTTNYDFNEKDYLGLFYGMR